MFDVGFELLCNFVWGVPHKPLLNDNKFTITDQIYHKIERIKLNKTPEIQQSITLHFPYIYGIHTPSTTKQHTFYLPYPKMKIHGHKLTFRQHQNRVLNTNIQLRLSQTLFYISIYKKGKEKKGKQKLYQRKILQKYRKSVKQSVFIAQSDYQTRVSLMKKEKKNWFQLDCWGCKLCG